MPDNKIEIFYVNNKPAYCYIPTHLRLDGIEKLSGLIGPSNLSWKKQVTFNSPLEYISAKRLKRIKKALIQAEKDFSIILSESLSQSDYDDWFILYSNSMASKETGIVRLTPNWYQKHEDPEKLGSIMIRENTTQRLIGGVIIIKNKGQSKIQCAYRAHEHIHIKDSSLASIIEYYIDQYALTYGWKLITRGTDSNIYGIRLNIGLHDFKQSNGFVPFPLDTSSNYYPRKLVFFQPYDEILTYIYDESSETGIRAYRGDTEAYMSTLSEVFI
jgi:hypothetical protein